MFLRDVEMSGFGLEQVSCRARVLGRTWDPNQTSSIAYTPTAMNLQLKNTSGVTNKKTNWGDTSDALNELGSFQSDLFMFYFHR